MTYNSGDDGTNIRIDRSVCRRLAVGRGGGDTGVGVVALPQTAATTAHVSELIEPLMDNLAYVVSRRG